MPYKHNKSNTNKSLIWPDQRYQWEIQDGAETIKSAPACRWRLITFYLRNFPKGHFVVLCTKERASYRAYITFFSTGRASKGALLQCFFFFFEQLRFLLRLPVKDEWIMKTQWMSLHVPVTFKSEFNLKKKIIPHPPSVLHSNFVSIIYWSNVFFFITVLSTLADSLSLY